MNYDRKGYIDGSAIQSLLVDIANLLFSSQKKSTLIIYDDYLQESPILKDIKKKSKKEIIAYHESFVHEKPLSALSRLSLEAKTKFDLILNTYSRIAGRKVGWWNKKLDINVKARENWIMIFQSLTLLTEKGNSLAIVEPMFWISLEGKRFIEELNKKGFYINAIFQAPPLLKGTIIKPYIIHFSRTKIEKIFVSDLDEGFNLKKIISNYKNKESKNIYEGLFIKEEKFKGFNIYKSEKEFDLLAKQYKKYEKVNIKDIVLGHKTKDFTKADNAIYLRMAGNFKAVNFEDITKNRYVQLTLDTTKVDPNYFKFFLNSDIGTKFLDSLGNGSIIKSLQLDVFLNSKIYLLPLDLQKDTVSAMQDIDSFSEMFSKFRENVLLSPDKCSSVIIELHKVKKSLETVTEEEELLSLIRSGENKNVEFKQTLSKNIKTKQKDKVMEDMVLKTICGFMNTDGGTLFVGVMDSGELYGIDKDVYPNHDEYLKHVRNILKDNIGLGFLPLIDYEIKKLQGKDILVVKCKRSDKPVFCGKDEIFYVRSNPATDALSGRRMMEYIKNHFDN